MFTDNKYRRWYGRIIDRALVREASAVYTERHHIVPKSIVRNERTVRLTAKEHFVCHWLLTKFTEGNDLRNMNYALAIMSRVASTSLEYEKSRKASSEAMKNRYVSEETRRKMSEIKRGFKHTEAAKKIMSEKSKAYSRTPEHQERLSESLRGKKRSESSRMRMRESALRRAPKSQETKDKAAASMKRYWQEKKAALSG